MNPFDIYDRNIVVTGANGYLGRTLTLGLLEQGANVLALSRNLSDLNKLIQNRFTDRLLSLKVDCNSEQDVSSALDSFCKNFGPVDGVFNNAYSATRRPGFDMSLEQIHETFQNCFVHYWTTIRTAIRYFRTDGGSIVNNSSLWAELAPNLDMYLDLENEPSIALSVAKASVNQLTRYLSTYLADKNIRINSLVPGTFPQMRGKERLDYMEQLQQRIPMRRIGKPLELLGPLIFLLSDASSYMTGQIMYVDGGFSVY